MALGYLAFGRRKSTPASRFAFSVAAKSSWAIGMSRGCWSQMEILVLLEEIVVNLLGRAPVFEDQRDCVLMDRSRED